MKGWILTENDKPVITSNNSIEVFRTKEDLFESYGASLGDLNKIKRLNFEIENLAVCWKCESFEVEDDGFCVECGVYQ